MNNLERKQIERYIKRARDQRNATINNQDFDYWNERYEHFILLLKTGESK